MVIRYLIEKEFLQIRRNAILPRLFVMLPLVLLIVVPFAANQEIKNLKFCVVDNDHSSFSEDRRIGIFLAGRLLRQSFGSHAQHRRRLCRRGC